MIESKMDNRLITRQALPESDYLELLGIALCVFNSNSSFMIENILRFDEENKRNWYTLIDLNSGRLQPIIRETVGKHNLGQQTEELFVELVNMRNRIVHGFQVTYEGKQILATKDHDNKQFIISEEHLKSFIRKNERMSDLLHTIRGY